MKILYVLALVATAALAQPHQHGFSAAEMGMTEAEHAKMHDIPPGTGLSADGSGFLRAPVAGSYIFIGAKLAEFPAGPAKITRTNRVYRVLPHVGPMQWILPGTTKAMTVPKEFLYPSIRR